MIIFPAEIISKTIIAREVKFCIIIVLDIVQISILEFIFETKLFFKTLSSYYSQVLFLKILQMVIWPSSKAIKYLYKIYGV